MIEKGVNMKYLILSFLLLSCDDSIYNNEEEVNLNNSNDYGENLDNNDSTEDYSGVLEGSCIEILGECYDIDVIVINLEDAQLSGEIPSELGNLTNLTTLNLSNNELSGEIPSELGNLTNLTTLNLSNNELSGEIPAELGNLTNLTTLNLSNNELIGYIPYQFCDNPDINLIYSEGVECWQATSPPKGEF